MYKKHITMYLARNKFIQKSVNIYFILHTFVIKDNHFGCLFDEKMIAKNA